MLIILFFLNIYEKQLIFLHPQKLVTIFPKKHQDFFLILFVSNISYVYLYAYYFNYFLLTFLGLIIDCIMCFCFVYKIYFLIWAFIILLGINIVKQYPLVKVKKKIWYISYTNFNFNTYVFLVFIFIQDASCVLFNFIERNNYFFGN